MSSAKPVQKKQAKANRRRNRRVVPVTQGPARAPVRRQKIEPLPHIVTESTSPLVISNLRVDAVLDPTSVQLPFIAFYSHLCQMGVMTQLSNSAGQPAPYQAVASALMFFYDNFQSMLAGGPVAPTRVPVVFRDIMSALLPKIISTRAGSTISYGWAQHTPAPLTPYTVGNVPWLFQEPDTDDAGPFPVSNPVFPTPDATAYNKVMASLDSYNHRFLKLVDNDVSASKLSTSVSAFARNYVYNGLQNSGGSTAGFYKDVELEVPIFNPYIAQFTGYGSDTRAPRYISISSGDACVPYALPQHGDWGGYANQGHVIYKFIDFENIYDTLCLWAVKCKESLISDTPAGTNTNNYTYNFPFSAQEFRIVLRQALMSFFGENYWTQFQGPLNSDVDNNWFQAFYCTGNTYGAATFAQFQLPQLIRENLAALKYRVLNAGKKNKLHIVPVLGRYRTDTRSEFSIPTITATPESPPYIEQCPLFAPGATQVVNLIDGSMINGYINLNGTFYANVMADWNSFCGAVNKVSTRVVALGGDSGPPGLVALSMTRQLQDSSYLPTHDSPPVELQLDERFAKRQSLKQKPALAPPPVRPLEIQKRVVNYQKPIGEKLTAIPASSSSKLVPVSITSIKSLNAEELSFYENLILPTVRFDTYSQQYLNISKYQTEVSEFASAQLVQTNNLSHNPGQSYSALQVWSTLAGYCVKGSGGECSEYAKIMDVLCLEGHAGFLSSILGGIVKTVLPSEVYSIVDSVAGLLPV